MQEVYTELKKLGGDVVALSVDDVQSAVDMKDAYDLEFPVLYDTDASVVRQWELYDLLGDGLSAPATFIIRTDGTVESALIGQTIADRPTTDSILDTLASLAGMNRAAMAEGPAGSGNEVVASAPVRAPAIGDLAPDFRLPTAGGQTVSLGDYLGEQNVVVVFFRAWW